ncbi:putative E3 ubiquitin-protein ligase XBAT35 isoform X2 [Eutrema salsugineum]|uniref:putative E3 ubiquitin-protein ligase XBAT35 isoform X2 n=1 Tax=Eutrema salsugineum TaxID=72664 RepID=UPI000CECF89D|nr:putative E3 ubiquitin-protein ligase XBAT35 isoform X2 [Eutrema salsugineum]
MGQLFEQVSHKDNEDTKSLGHEDAGLEWVDKEGRTPFILACTKLKLFDGEKTLLQLGSDVNAFRFDCNGETPLHHAANIGLENTVKLLLSHGANPLVLNDDFQTPLEVARAQGYSNIVRTIESHICLFSGWMREFYGPSYVELFAPQLLSRRVWVVIVPTGSQNPTKPFKLELVVYASLQDAQPRTVIPLWKAKLEEPKSDQSDASVMIGPTRKRQRRRGYISHARRWAQVDWQMRLKLAPAKRGDIQQLNWFCEACKGIPQPLNPPICENNVSNEVAPSVYPLRAVAAVEDGSIHYPSVDVDLSLPCEKCEDKEDGGGSRVCVICVDSSSEAVCVPCGHVAGCVSCLKEIKDKKLGCPVCRADIDQVVKLYHV